VIACWPSDAGHDYEIREGRGFSGRIVEDHGKPVFIKTEN
jgi:glucose-6-phosphate isomerase